MATKMAHQTNSKVPKIRFKGFEVEWKQVSLGEVLTERNVLQKITKDAPILAFAAGQGVIPRSERKSNNRDHLTLDQANKFYKLTEYDDLVYNPSNLKYGAIDRNKHGRGVISPIYVTFTTKEIPCFIEPIIKSEKFKLKALLYEEGTVVKRQSVKPENLLLLDVWITAIPEEQSEIGAYFKGMDRLIGLHQRKHDKLVALKKAMLQKMFPQPGATTPEIRFKGFLGAWLEKKLDEICEIVGGGTPSTSIQKYWGGDIDWYSPTEIGDEVYASGSVKKITLLGLSKSSARLLPPVKTVLFTSRAGIGDMAILTKEGCTNQGFQSMVLNDEIDPYFIFSMGHLIKIHALKHASGSTFLEVSSKQLGKMKIFLPKEDEQQKIGTYFRTLDSLISKHAIQLNKFQKIKSACLEKMFV